MAREIRSFEVTTIAGVTADAPTVTDLAMPPRAVERLHVVIPPGPAGNLGLRITMAGNAVIPINTGEWVITDNETIDWPMEGYPDSGAWQVTSYNIGQLDHTIYLRFLLNLVGNAQNEGPSIIPNDLLGVG